MRRGVKAVYSTRAVKLDKGLPMHRFPGIALVACISLATIVGCAHSQPPSQAQTMTAAAVPVQSLDEAASAVRLQATIHEVRVPPEKLGQLDAARLAKTDFSNHPSDLGSARALYVVDQKVSLAGDHLMVGSQEPMVTASRMTDRGQKVNTVQYNSLGAI